MLDWVSDTRLRVGDTDYDLMGSEDGAFTRLRLLKTRPMIEGYLPIVDEFRGGNVVELGIYRGGSTALFAQLLEPRRLVALELDPDRVAILDGFVADHDLDDVVRLHYGVDQADAQRVAATVDDELGGEPIDLVLDDASHLYCPTASSFEVLFPRLRPGGLYVIEDWRPHQDYLALFVHAIADRPSPVTEALEADLAVTLAKGQEPARLFFEWCAREILDPTSAWHAPVDSWFRAICADSASPASAVVAEGVRLQLDASAGRTEVTPSLTTLAAQLVLALACGAAGFGELTVNRYWIAIRRGPAPIDARDFRLHRAARDHLGTLAEFVPLDAAR